MHIRYIYYAIISYPRCNSYLNIPLRFLISPNSVLHALATLVIYIVKVLPTCIQLKSIDFYMLRRYAPTRLPKSPHSLRLPSGERRIDLKKKKKTTEISANATLRLQVHDPINSPSSPAPSPTNTHLSSPSHTLSTTPSPIPQFFPQPPKPPMASSDL